MLGYTAFYPLPKAAFAAPGVLAEGFEDAPIGNGPFKMKGTWEHDAQIEVETVRRLQGRPGRRSMASTFKIYQERRGRVRRPARRQPRRA